MPSMYRRTYIPTYLFIHTQESSIPECLSDSKSGEVDIILSHIGPASDAFCRGHLQQVGASLVRQRQGETYPIHMQCIRAPTLLTYLPTYLASNGPNGFAVGQNIQEGGLACR